MQVPEAHVSFEVQALPSLQGAVLLVYVHPLTGLQKSFVQTFPSLHTAESPVWTHPVAGLHVSIVQGMASSQDGGGPPVHTVPLQVSPVVQGLPSLHAPESTTVVSCCPVLLAGSRSDDALVMEAEAAMSPLPADRKSVV